MVKHSGSNPFRSSRLFPKQLIKDDLADTNQPLVHCPKNLVTLSLTENSTKIVLIHLELLTYKNGTSCC